MRTSRLLAASASAALLVALTACSGGSGAGDAATTGVAAPDAGGGSGGDARASAADGVAGAAEIPAAEKGTGSVVDQSAVALEQQALIKTGSVSLRSDDVGQTRFDVQRLVDDHEGTVGDDRTETDKSGSPLRSRMVLRVPVSQYDDVMGALDGLATLVSTSSTSEDVTTQVIDVDARIAVQQRSVQRVQVLLDRAQSIRDIVAIERELSNRQADLDSLVQQQAWLEDQTSEATITVHLERTPAKAAKQAEHRTGFLAGLSSGWDGLVGATTALLTALGALLPFAVVVLVIGVPVLLLVRRTRRHPAPPVATATGD